MPHELRGYAVNALTQALEYETLGSFVNHPLARDAVPADFRQQAMEHNGAFFEAVLARRPDRWSERWALGDAVQEGIALWNALQRALFAAWPRVIGTSATLSIENDLAWYERRVGLAGMGDTVRATIESPSDYKEHVLLYTPQGLGPVYGPGEDQYATRLAGEVRRLVTASRGRAFVLCTSTRRMNQVNAETYRWFDSLGGLQAAFDSAVLMKILPKFHGPRARLREPLLSVLRWAGTPEDIMSRIENTNAKYHEALIYVREWLLAPDFRGVPCPRVALKCLRMTYQLHTTGFAAFS